MIAAKSINTLLSPAIFASRLTKRSSSSMRIFLRLLSPITKRSRLEGWCHAVAPQCWTLRVVEHTGSLGGMRVLALCGGRLRKKERGDPSMTLAAIRALHEPYAYLYV